VLRYKPDMIFWRVRQRHYPDHQGVARRHASTRRGARGFGLVGQGSAPRHRFTDGVEPAAMPGNKEFVEAYHKAYRSALSGQRTAWTRIRLRPDRAKHSRKPRPAFKKGDVLATAEFTNPRTPTPR
jgi:hypothetical protein